jgi:hypothetical protein
MLQRINFILMLVVVAAVAFLSVQLFITQRQNATALRDITQRLELVTPGTAAPTGSISPSRPTRPAFGPGSAEAELREELPGRWQPAGDGQAPDPGAVLEITGAEDIMNLSGRPRGVLQLPGFGLQLQPARKATGQFGRRSGRPACVPGGNR